MRVKPDHPIPQRLAIHPADLGRVFPRGPIQHRRDRQKPSRLRGILRPFRNLADLAGCRTVTHCTNRLAHVRDTLHVCHLLNHATADLGNLREKLSQSEGWDADFPKAGIIPSQRVDEAKAVRVANDGAAGARVLPALPCLATRTLLSPGVDPCLGTHPNVLASRGCQTPFFPRLRLRTRAIRSENNRASAGRSPSSTLKLHRIAGERHPA